MSGRPSDRFEILGNGLLGAAAAAVLLGAAACAGDWAARAGGAARNPAVVRCELTIAPDFAARRLRCTCALTLDGLSAGALVPFRLNRWVSSVRVEGPSPVAIAARTGDAIELRFERPAPRESVVFTLEGVPGPSGGDDRPVLDDDSLYLLWSDAFYPLDLDAWAPTTTTLVLPAGFEAIAPGRLVRSETDGPLRTLRFETTWPTRAVSVLADRRWVRSSRAAGDLEIETFLHPECGDLAETILESSARVLAFYRELLGPYRFDGFRLATVRGLGARRAFPGFVAYGPAYLAREIATTGHDAHETALLWWGYTLGGKGPGSFQWIEGLGDYVEFLFDERERLPIPRIFESFRRDYLAMPADCDAPCSELRGSSPQEIVHGKLPWCMHVLRFVAGDAAFRRGLRACFERNAFRALTLEELVAALEEGMGMRLAWWREEWLERAGVPRLRLRTSVEEADGRWRVVLRITQLGSVYRIPLEVGLETAAGLRVERVALDGPETRAEIVLDAQPGRIVLDPQRWLLLRIED